MNTSPPPTPKGLVAWFAQNHVAANILMLFLIATGLASLGSMTREIFPAVDPGVITVSVIYPGASPEDVEEGITRRVEEALIGIQGIQRIASTASEGVGIITVELDDFVDENEILNDVETEIDRLRDFPPENAEEVSIVKAKRSAKVLTLSLYGAVPEKMLRSWAERVEDELLQLPDVSFVNITGGRAREIAIEISRASLRKYAISLGEVADAVRAHSIDLPGGTLRSEAGDILVRVQEKRYFGSEFESIVVRSNTDGSLLRLGDIATVIDGFVDEKIETRFNDLPALFLDITRSDAQDSLVIENQIQQYLTELELPAGLQVSMVKNRTDILRDRINLLLRNAIMGFTLVFIALLLFLDLKLAFWTSFAIPVSFLGGIFIASLFGVTINMITLFALIVVLGIVVDDAIIAGESIFAEQERGKKHLTAVMDGVNAVRAPVTIGVLTTIAAFAPLIFSTGTLGQIMQPIPIVVIGILMTSLLEAFFILPAHLSSSSRWSIGILAECRNAVTERLAQFIDRVITPIVMFCVRFRYATLGATIALVIIAVSLIMSGTIRFIFFPQIEGDEVRASLEMQVGTPYVITEKYAEQMYEAAIRVRDRYDEKRSEEQGSIFKHVAFSVGTQTGGDGPVSIGGASGTHLAQIEIELVPSVERSVSSSQVEREWRKEVGEIPGARKVAFESSLGRAGADINLELAHRNESALAAAAEQLKNQLQRMDGVSEVTDSFELGKQEYVFKLTDAGRAAGLTPASLGRQLRDAFYGREVQRIQRGKSEMKVLVRLPERERETRASLYDMRVRLPNGQEAELTTMATIQQQRSLTSINRVDGRRVVAVTANVDEGVTTPNEVLDVFNTRLMPQLEKDYPGLTFSLEGQSRDQKQDLATLGKNMLIALMIIFVMLGSQLRSYAKPFIILMTVPIGVTGAILAHC